MKNSKINASFESGILTIKFADGASLNVSDLKEMYAFGEKESKGQAYCILFEALGHYETSEEAIEFLSDNSGRNILAKAYVINRKETEIKTKLHLLFDAPSIIPQTFATEKEGRMYLLNLLEKNQTH